MAELDEKLQGILKNKKILIPAIAIGAIAGLYVLSKSGGGGAGGLAPESPLAPQQPGTGDGGGTGYDDAGIIGRLTQIEANQQGFAAQFMQALSDAINGVRGENASALQSVIDQVNGQLSSGQNTPGQTVPDFSGFYSQITDALGQINTTPQRVAETGDILKRQFGTGVRPPSLLESGNRAPFTLNKIAQTGSNTIASAFKSIVPRSSGLSIPQSSSGIGALFGQRSVNPTQSAGGIGALLGASFARSVRQVSSAPSRYSVPARPTTLGSAQLFRSVGNQVGQTLKRAPAPVRRSGGGSVFLKR